MPPLEKKSTQKLLRYDTKNTRQGLPASLKKSQVERKGSGAGS